MTLSLKTVALTTRGQERATGARRSQSSCTSAAAPLESPLSPRTASDYRDTSINILALRFVRILPQTGCLLWICAPPTVTPMGTFTYRSTIQAPASQLFEWHTRPGALQRVNAPWDPVQIVAQPGDMKNGARTTMKLLLGPISVPWTIEHCDYQPGRSFKDVQRSGPFARWEHTHRIEIIGAHTSELIDQIDYELPFGTAGRALGERYTRQKLERLFAYRHRIIASDLLLQQRCPFPQPLRVAISGASGLVGSSLAPLLGVLGHQGLRLVRDRNDRAPDAVFWDPEHGEGEVRKLEGIDAVVHLAGESIASGRWNEAKRSRIHSSRVAGTRALVRLLSSLTTPPKMLLSASAVGIYGDRQSEVLTEKSESGSGFLAEVAREWEEASLAFTQRGSSVSLLRFGVILSLAGGALAKLYPPFTFGAGGPIGSGSQFMSWIALDDVLAAIVHLLHRTISGPCNIVAPQPVTNKEFSRTLAHVLKRPALLPAPAFALRAAFGSMADEVLLAGQRALPEALGRSGYQFLYPELEMALRHLTGR